jgi:hypothetical protein
MRKVILVIISILAFAILYTLIFCGQVSALTWNFENKAEADDWKAIRGKWEVDLKEGALVGSSDLDEGTAIVSEKAWNKKWVNYTLEVKVRNMGTENHFGIGFRDDGAGNHYGFYLNDFVGPETKYWFGTFSNNVYTALAGSWAEDGNYKDAEKWNVMKVVVKDFTYELYVNDKLLKSVTDKTFKDGPIALVSDRHQKTAIAQFDYVKIEGEGIPMAVQSLGKLSAIWANIKQSY